MTATTANPTRTDWVLFLKNHLFDVLMLAGFALSLGFFVFGSMDVESKSGIGGPMATLVTGTAERKSGGGKGFLPISPGQELYDLDAVWTGKGQTAELQLENQLRVTLAERTLIVLKRPFRRHFRMSLEDQVRVVSGEVKLGGGAGFEGAKPLKLQGNENLKGRSRNKSVVKQELKVFPPHESHHYYRNPGMIEMKFTWGGGEADTAKKAAFSGYLKIVGTTSGEVQYLPLTEASFVTMNLKNGNEYQWSIIDDRKANLLGPFLFELHVLDNEIAKKLLKGPASNSVFVYW